MNRRLKNYLSVGIFAFFGGALRAYLNLIWSQAGTFTANIIGCFLLAFFTYFFVEYREVKPYWIKRIDKITGGANRFHKRNYGW